MINAQQQKGKPNEQVVSGKIVQSEIKQEIKAPETVQTVQPKPSGVLGRLRAKSGEEHNQSKIENVVRTEPSVVEQPRPVEKSITVMTSQGDFEIPVTPTMPSGLSLLTQMKWKREHASSSVDNVVASKVQSVTEKTQVSQNNSGEKTQAVLGDTIPASASQHADAQKTNDGVADIEELKRNLAHLANNIEQPALVGQVVRTIAQQIANSPQLCPHMTRGEVNLMVRGLRMSYQVAAMKKQEKVDSKAAKSKGTQELGQMFKDAGIDFAGLNLNLK